MALTKNDIVKLVGQLNQTGLSTTNQPLYQVIKELIESLNAINKAAGLISGSGPAGPSGKDGIPGFILGDSSGSGDDGLVIPGPRGIDGANGMVPYFIATGEVFTIPIYKQALFSMNIDNEGSLVIDGFLIEVD